MIELGILLTLVLFAVVWITRFRAHRCETKGHRWIDTPTGMVCQRCKHGLKVGDRM